MTIKRKLVPFFAAGVVVSSFAARAQTANNPDTSSSATTDPDAGSSATGQAPGTQSSYPTGDSTGAAGNAMPVAPSSPNQSSSGSASTPGTSGDGTATSPPANSSSSTDSSSTDSSATGMSPDAGGSSK